MADCDIIKDSNLDLTLLSHVIHEAQLELENRGVGLPQTLRLHSDNASAELKNNNCFKFCSWLCHRKLFKEILVTMFRVGHSHSKIDQRFSECRGVLADHANLECPTEFLTALKKVKAREGRTLNLEYVEAVADFGAFFDQLPVNVSGHTQTRAKTEQGQEAVHVFSFSLRGNLPSSAGQVEERFPGHEPHPEDVILSVRLYVSSKEGSQPPQVIIPHAVMASFDPLGQGPTHVHGRRELTQRQVAEFTKTAHAVSQPPWNMHSASSYLLRLVTVSQEGGDPNWKPPSMTWTLRGTRSSVPPALVANAVQEEDMQFMVRTPAPVAVAPKPKAGAAKTRAKAGMKRPAAADPNLAQHPALDAQASGVSKPAESDAVSLPSQPDEFEAAPPLPATTTSAAHGAPPRTVVEPPAPAQKKRKGGWLPMPKDRRTEAW